MSAQQLKFNELFSFITDCAALSVFDPAVLKHRMTDECDWFADNFFELPEVASGQCAFVGLGCDGGYRVRVTEHDLTEEEQAFAKYHLQLGVRIQSGQCFIGALEKVPGGDSTPTLESVNSMHGGFLKLANGDYDLNFYGMDFDLLDVFPDEADQAMQKRLPEIVIQINKRTGFFAAPKGDDDKLFTDDDKKYMFKSAIRARISAKKRGENLVGKKIKVRAFMMPLINELVISEYDCDLPRGHFVKLSNYPNVKENDHFLVELISFDKGNKIYAAKVLEKLKADESSPGIMTRFINAIKRILF